MGPKVVRFETLEIRIVAVWELLGVPGHSYVDGTYKVYWDNEGSREVLCLRISSAKGSSTRKQIYRTTTETTSSHTCSARKCKTSC
jgi:hypothetical protein